MPYSDKEIRRGVNDVDLWLCSPGGAGSNMFKNYLHQFMRVKSPYMAGLLTHHSEPVQCSKENFKAIFIHRHPIKALNSMKRRGLVRTNIRKLNNSRRMPVTDRVLMESIFRQFTNWTTKSVNYPILCVKYEGLFENRNLIGKFLKLDLDDFPDPKFTSTKGSHNSDLYESFEKEIASWENFPDVLLIESKA
ncbi:MAG: hypothetical protein GY816_15475 [Cytophagales bacterium]|nr:hypothetical protein [Cytophagales bacterium]